MKIVKADSFFKRLIGLMFKKSFDYILEFDRCNSIHTFFMRTNIDVYMTDKNKKILFIYKDLKPNKIILPKKGVHIIYESPVNSLNYKINDTF